MYSGGYIIAAMAHKDSQKRAEYNRAYRAANREALNERERVRYHVEGGRETQQTYRRGKLNRYAFYQREWRRKNPKETMVINAKVRAKKYGFPCDISVEMLEWPTHCPIFGIELDYSATKPGERKQRANYPTLDRRVNDLGYVKGNVFVISHKANRIKSDATVEQLEAIARYARYGLVDQLTSS